MSATRPAVPPLSPTLAALHRAVVQNPDDTDLRLVYAEACEDAGDLDRAEFIRLECELYRQRNPAGPRPAASPANDRRQDALEARCLKLLRANGQLWDPLPEYVERASTRPGVITYARGFVEHVTCTRKLWERFGPEIVLAAPVRGVSLADRKPRLIYLSRGAEWDWWVDGWVGGYLQNVLPCELPQEWLDAMESRLWGHEDGKIYRRSYGSEEEANDALSAGLVRWARRKAGLDP